MESVGTVQTGCCPTCMYNTSDARVLLQLVHGCGTILLTMRDQLWTIQMQTEDICLN